MYNSLVSKYFSDNTFHVNSPLEITQIFEDFNIHQLIDDNKNSPENIKFDSIEELLISATLTYDLVDDAIDFSVFETEITKPKFCIIGQNQSIYILNIEISESMAIAFFNAVGHYLMPNALELECVQATALIDSIDEVISRIDHVFSKHHSMIDGDKNKITLSYVHNTRVRVLEIEEIYSGIESKLYELQDPSDVIGGIENGVGSNLVKTAKFANYYVENTIAVNNKLKQFFSFVRTA